MIAPEAAAMVKIFTVLSPSVVIEYGAGGSTITFPASCSKLTLWLSIEHNPIWFEKVTQLNVDPRVQIKHLPERADYCAVSHESPDIVFIDGIHRETLLEIWAKKKLDGTVVVIHDAYRPSYQKPMTSFPFRKDFLSTLPTGLHPLTKQPGSYPSISVLYAGQCENLRQTLQNMW